MSSLTKAEGSCALRPRLCHSFVFSVLSASFLERDNSEELSELSDLKHRRLNGDCSFRWYHGSITRIEAEGLLRIHQEGSYLVRNSESTKQDYSLSLK